MPLNGARSVARSEVRDGRVECGPRRDNVCLSELDLQLVDGVVLFQSRLGIDERLDGHTYCRPLDKNVDGIRILEQGCESLFGTCELCLGQLDFAVCELDFKLRGLHQYGQCRLCVQQVGLCRLDGPVLGFKKQLVRLAGERGKRLNAVGQLGLSRRDI